MRRACDLTNLIRQSGRGGDPLGPFSCPVLRPSLMSRRSTLFLSTCRAVGGHTDPSQPEEDPLVGSRSDPAPLPPGPALPASAWEDATQDAFPDDLDQTPEFDPAEPEPIPEHDLDQT
jgi:hypothetical protein